VEFLGFLEGEALRTARASLDVIVDTKQDETFGVANAEAVAHGWVQ
jgi:hypothetical protein